MTKTKIFRIISLLYNAGLGVVIVILALKPEKITTGHVFLLTGLTFISLILTFFNRQFERQAKAKNNKKDSSNDSVNS